MQLLFIGSDKGFSLCVGKYLCYVISEPIKVKRSSSDMAHGGVWADIELWKMEGEFRIYSAVSSGKEVDVCAPVGVGMSV